MATTQVLIATGLSYTPASAASAGSLQGLAFATNQLIAASDSSVSFAVNSADGFASVQSEVRAFFSGFHGDLEAKNATELEVNAASDTEDVVYVVNNHNDNDDEVTVYKLIPNPSVTGNWQISAFKIPTDDYDIFNPESAVVIEGAIYFGGGADGATKTRNITGYNFDTNAYAASPAFTFYAVAGTLEGMSYDGTYLYGLIRAGSGNLDTVEQWLWNATPANRTLVQVYDLYDVPVFKILRDENVAEGRTASDGSWKPHAVEKTPGAMYVGNNSRNLTVGGVAVAAEAYGVTLPTGSGLSSDIRFLTSLQQARNTNTDQPEIQKGIQIAGMEDSKNLDAATYSANGATLDGTTRFALYNENMLQTTGGWSMAVTVTASGTPASNAGVVAIQYNNSGTTTNSYLRVNSNGSWRFRWNGKSIDSSIANGPTDGKQQRLFLEYDQSGGNLYLSAIDANNPTVTVVASSTVSALSGFASRLSLADKDTSGTPSSSNGGWVGTLKDFVIYETFMDFKSGVREPSLIPQTPQITASQIAGVQVTASQVGV